MGEVVAAIANGTSEPIEVDVDERRVRTLPSRAQLRVMQARLGRPLGHDDVRRALLPGLPEPPQ